MSDATIRWAIADPASLTWRDWDGEIILYDDRSGDVHRFTGVTAELFETLLVAPADALALAAQVAKALDVEPDFELEMAINEALRDLHMSGVVVSQLGG